MQNKDLEAQEDISEVFKFEFWLRFYFIEEENGKLSINLDDQVIEKMEKEYGHLSNIASSLNKIELTPETCRQIIVEHLMDQFDGKKFEIGYIPKTLDTVAFKSEIQLFNTWAHLYEEQLDKNVLGFNNWIKLYEEWKKSESAEKIRLSLSMQEVRQNGNIQSEKTN